MITVQQFIHAVDEAASEIHEYDWGASGDNGKCDCIGLIMDSLRKCGFKWPGTHGTNWTARNAMKELKKLTVAGDLFLGEVVFKARAPGDEKYKLPDSYKNSGDLFDYYHVGVVTAVKPLCITHCTDVPGGIQRDNKLGAWAWGGRLKYVDYEEGGDTVEENYKAKVVAAQGNTVNMRKSASSKADVVRKIPIGTVVTVIKEYNDGWDYIGIDGTTGYMMKQFLQKVNDDSTDENEYVTITLRKDIYEALKESVIDAGGI